MFEDGGYFESSFPLQDFHHLNLEVENSSLSQTGRSLPQPSSKRRLISTDSDKENEFPSLIQFSASNVFNYQHQQDSYNISQDRAVKSLTDAANDSNQEKFSQVEEDIDHLLTDLFNGQDDSGGNFLESPSKFELPEPEEIGWTSVPEPSQDFLLSFGCNNNQAGSDNCFTVEPWQLYRNNEFDLQNYSFPNLDELEDQDAIDARGLIANTLKEVAQSEDGAESSPPPGVQDVFVGTEISSLDENTKTALEILQLEEITDLSKDDIVLDIGEIENQISEDLLDEDERPEARCEKNEEVRDQMTEATISSSPPGVVPAKASIKTELVDCAPPAARTRRGRKRKQGTVVDLLVSSYVKKRSSRCKECGPCKAPDCGECVFCLDKPKFGGPNKKKNACQERKCTNMIPKLSKSSSQESPALDDEDIPIDIIGHTSFDETAHTPGNAREAAEENEEEITEEVDGKPKTVVVMKQLNHDHCYCLNIKDEPCEHSAATYENIDLSCHESLEEFIAETIGVKLQKNLKPSDQNNPGEMKALIKQENSSVSAKGAMEIEGAGLEKLLSEHNEVESDCDNKKVKLDFIQSDDLTVKIEKESVFEKATSEATQPKPKLKRRRISKDETKLKKQQPTRKKNTKSSHETRNTFLVTK